MSNTQEPILSEEEQHYSHIIVTRDHFGFSQEEDEFVKSSDFITVLIYTETFSNIPQLSNV